MQVHNLALCNVNLIRLVRDHLSSLLRSLWMASLPSNVQTTPLSLESSANLLRVHSSPPSMSLIKMSKSTGPKTDPWGTPHVTSLYLAIESLIATLFLWPFKQFLTHHVVHPSDLHLSNLKIGM